MASGIALQTSYKVEWADRRPTLSQLGQIDFFFQSPAYETRGETGPYHVSKKAGDVVEDSHLQGAVVNKSQVTDARSNAGAHDGHLAITLPAQPGGRLANFQYRLANRLQCPTQIRADHEIGPTHARRATVLMVRECEPQGRYSQSLQDPAEPDMAIRFSIPLGNHHHSASRARRLE